jgi:hypothetical protein
VFLGGYVAGVLLRDLRWRDAGDEGEVVESGGRRWLVVPVESDTGPEDTPPPDLTDPWRG